MSKEHVVIVGAGAWGASTAVSLLKSGKYTVTLLDRGTTLPTSDAASHDMNKIARADYRKKHFRDMAHEALQKWGEREWDGMYHETGTVVVAPKGDKGLKDTITLSMQRCPDITIHDTPEAVEEALDPMNKSIAGDMTGRTGYSNPLGGWVDAAKATEHLINKAKDHTNGTVKTGAEVSSFLYKDGDVKGVRCLNGDEFWGDKVIVASGAWTENLMGDLLPSGLLTSVGIVVAGFRLTDEQYERYKDIPVFMGWDDGMYCMPPTPDTKTLKFGLADRPHGYTTKSGIPRTTLTPGAADWHERNNASWLPQQSFEALRVVTERYLPEFKDRPFDFTRMCPIPDTFDGEFLLDYHNKYPSLLVASGGSDHSYKMMPIIGDYVRRRMEGTLDPDLAKLWAVRTPHPAGSTGEPNWPYSVEGSTFANKDSVLVGSAFQGTAIGTALSA